jgi:hypothetical protein
MGRHSAPDDDEREIVPVAPVVDPRPRSGRHSRPDDEAPPPLLLLELDKPVPPRTAARPAEETLADQDTERIRPEQIRPERIRPERVPRKAAIPMPPAPGTELVPVVEQNKTLVRVTKGSQSTAADLELLRKHSEVRARVIAAIVAPFVLYTVVMYLIAALNVYFIWVWLPLVTAGILAGSILDAAHRRRAKQHPDG